jgi:hypothetical protein
MLGCDYGASEHEPSRVVRIVDETEPMHVGDTNALDELQRIRIAHDSAHDNNINERS